MNTIHTLSAGRGKSGSGGADPAAHVAAPPRRWKTRIGLPVVLLMLVVGVLVVSSWNVLIPAADVQVVPVIVKNVEGSSGSVTVQAPGWLEPDPHPYYVTTLVNGSVRDVLVLEGERVEEGQIVARLIDDDAKLALRRAEATVGQRLGELEEARAAHVAAVEVLDTLVDRHRNLATAVAAVDEAVAAQATLDADITVQQASLASLDDELARKQPLVESGTVSEGAIRRLQLQRDGTLASIEALRAKRIGLDATLARREAELLAAQQHLSLLIEEKRLVSTTAALLQRAEQMLEAAKVARDEAALALERTEIRAPMGGIVLRRLVSPGSSVMLNGSMEFSSHIVHLYEPEHLQARADVPLVDASHVGVGQRAEVVVDVLPDRVFTGVITRIVHEADIAKNTMQVKVRIDEPSEELKPEMLTRVRLLASERSSKSGTSRQRIFVPRSLVRGDGASAAVLIITSAQQNKGVAQLRSITLGTTRIDNWIEVTAGLQPGDQLIAQPTNIQPGQRVRITGEAAIAGNGVS